MSCSQPCGEALAWRAKHQENWLVILSSPRKPRWFRPWLPVLVLACLFAGTASTVLAQAEALEEYQVKAAYL